MTPHTVVAYLWSRGYRVRYDADQFRIMFVDRNGRDIGWVSDDAFMNEAPPRWERIADTFLERFHSRLYGDR